MLSRTLRRGDGLDICVGSKSNESIFIREEEKTRAQRKSSCELGGAGLVQPHAQGHLDPPEAGRQGKCSPRAFGSSTAQPTP